MTDEDIKRRLMSSVIAFNIVVILYMAIRILAGPRIVGAAYFGPFLVAVGLGLAAGGIVFAVMTIMKL